MTKQTKCDLVRLTKMHRLIFTLLFAAQIVSATCDPPDCLDPLAPVFDTHQWTVVQSVFTKFGKDHPESWVRLLKSIQPTGQDGVEGPLCSVNLIVVEKGKLLYSYAPITVPAFDPKRIDPVYYMDDRGVEAGSPLEVRDVTGDGIPEVMFHSGWAAASDWETDVHVLQYASNEPTHFREIRDKGFHESWWWKFKWANLNEQELGIVAEPIYKSDTIEESCHGCAKAHKYRVYRWSREKDRFVVIRTIPKTGKLHNEENPLVTDWKYIVGKLKGIK